MPNRIANMQLHPSRRLVYLTAGAGGMFCGSCMHDNALSRALNDAGWDVRLVATYTPIRTDEADFSVDHVLFGGINVFLQQKIPLFRHLPAVLDRFLDSPGLIRRVTAKAIDTDPKTLGRLTISMLKGAHGNQRKEVDVMCRWLEKTEPEVLLFSNILIGGSIPELRRRINVPVIVTLQGDDVFLDSLLPPFRQQAIEQIKRIVGSVDAFIVHTDFYRQTMSDCFDIPLDKIFVTPLGLKVSDFVAIVPRRDTGRTIGYLARLAPEKGLHVLVDAFIKFKSMPGHDDVRLSVAGWLGATQEAYANEQWERLRAAGLGDHFEYLGAIDRDQKLNFLSSIDLLSVPATYLEPKALYALEAMAAGVPVVGPDHGAFPELAADTGGVELFSAGDASALAGKLAMLLADEPLRTAMGQRGKASVCDRRDAAAMAASTAAVIETVLNQSELS